MSREREDPEDLCACGHRRGDHGLSFLDGKSICKSCPRVTTANHLGLGMMTTFSYCQFEPEWISKGKLPD